MPVSHTDFPLYVGDRCAYGDLLRVPGAYSQMTWMHSQRDVEELVQTLGLTTVPYAVCFGNGEIWACFDELYAHPQVEYMLVGFGGKVQ